ncbi:MAG: EAL domain-containing protein [Phycisphaerales bacterium]
MTATLHHRRILLVDDQPHIHEDYRKILSPRESSGALDRMEAKLFGASLESPDRAEAAAAEAPYVIDSAMQGQEAFELVKAAVAHVRPYSLAFVDMRMPPGWDGLETIERLWSVDPRLQIVICSAYSDHSREDILARTGGGDRLVILRKPFDPIEVAQLADAMTAKWLASRQADIRASELEARVAMRTAELVSTTNQLQRNLAELQSTRSALETSEERYALSAAGANDGLWDWDLQEDLIHVSDRWSTIVGLPASQATRTPDDWFGRVDPVDRERLKTAVEDHLTGKTDHLSSEHRLALPDGRTIWVLCRGLAVRDRDGRPTRMAGSLTDISQRKQFEQELRFGALHDRLTGLPNRTLLMECLDAAIANRGTDDTGLAFALLFLDLDNFKVINDSLGHHTGDELLIAIADRVTGAVEGVHSGRQTVARLGGDEFVVLLQDLSSRESATAVANSIHRSLDPPITIRGVDIQAATSIGIAIDDGCHDSASDVLRDADIAMYAAKQAGSSLHVVFDAEMRRRAMSRMDIENELRSTLRDGGIDVVYQPIVDLETGDLMAIEALARWEHPRLGKVRPERFVSIAEETGLVVQLGELVLARACQDVSDLRASHPMLRDLTVNVNLSSRHFIGPGLVEYIRRTLLQYDLPGEGLAVEITETAVMENFDAAATIIGRLRTLDVRVHLDDFGTGYSSLSCLKQLPLTGIKLDRSFIARLDDGRTATSAIIHAIVTLADHLKLGVVAEGVETREQLAAVLALECHLGQGYLFGRPMPASSIRPWLMTPTVDRYAA